ncbi:MAG: WG repeat-containing protein, partial [Cyanobacteria bacterium SZAS LIN-2]|nr:WG repeat-containing protein [Cyanobacteria bacterium SZAS LIN-2]
MHFLSKNQFSILAVLICICWFAQFFVMRCEAYTRVGLTDARGHEIIPCKYKSLYRLSNGFYLAEEFDPTNVISPSFSCKLFNRDGKELPVSLPKGCTLCDIWLPGAPAAKEGSTAFPPGTVQKIRTEIGYSIADMQGNNLLPYASYEFIEPLQEGLVRVAVGHNQYLFDLRRRELIPVPDKELMGPYKDGVIPFRTTGRQRMCGLLDRKGKVIFEGPFEFISAPVGGLAMAATRGSSPSCIRMDEAGNIVTPSDPHSVLVDMRGKIVSPAFDVLFPFDGEFARARLGDRYGLVNHKFEFVTPTKYSFMIPVKTGLYGVMEPGARKFSVIDKAGKAVCGLPSDVIAFESEYMQRDMIVCRLKSDPQHQLLGCFNTSGKELWRGTQNDLSKYKNSSGTELDRALQRLLSGQLNPDPDRIVKYETDAGFSPRDWKDLATKRGGNGLNRIDEFHKLLESYNLIGMRREKVL